MAPTPSKTTRRALEPVGSPQGELFHETWSDALRASVIACGGYKSVGVQIRPHMPPEQAARMVANWFNAERPEKPSLDELMEILWIARRNNVLLPLTWLGMHLGCDIKPLEPNEVEKRAKKARRAALLAELARLDDDE